MRSERHTFIVRTYRHTDTHRVFLGQQLLIVFSVAAKLVSQLHLAVDGLGQVLGQDVVMSLRVRERQLEV